MTSMVMGTLTRTFPLTPITSDRGSGYPGVDQPSPGEIMKGHDDRANLQSAVIDDAHQTENDVTVAEGCPTMTILEFLEINYPPDPDSEAEI